MTGIFGSETIHHTFQVRTYSLVFEYMIDIYLGRKDIPPSSPHIPHTHHTHTYTQTHTPHTHTYTQTHTPHTHTYTHTTHTHTHTPHTHTHHTHTHTPHTHHTHTHTTHIHTPHTYTHHTHTHTHTHPVGLVLTSDQFVTEAASYAPNKHKIRAWTTSAIFE